MAFPLYSCHLHELQEGNIRHNNMLDNRRNVRTSPCFSCLRSLVWTKNLSVEVNKAAGFAFPWCPQDQQRDAGLIFPALVVSSNLCSPLPECSPQELLNGTPVSQFPYFPYHLCLCFFFRLPVILRVAHFLKTCSPCSCLEMLQETHSGAARGSSPSGHPRATGLL